MATSDKGIGIGNTQIDPKNRVVFVNASYVSRLAPTGAIDTGFGVNGKTNLNMLLGLNSGVVRLTVVSAATQPNGDILVGGLESSGSQINGTGVLFRLLGSNPPAGFVSAVAGTIAAGGAADGTVQALNPANRTYTAAGMMTIPPGLAGAVRTAVVDVTGDGIPDYITGLGPGGPPGVTVFDGMSGNTAADLLAFEPGFTGGVFVSAADLDGDGKAEIIVTPDQGGGPRVVVFSVAPGGATTQRASFFGIDDPNFRGGARTGVGDINGDGVPDLAVAAGFQGGPRIAVFDGARLFASRDKLLNDFFAFEDALRNGAYVAIGDLNGDGFGDLFFGAGPGGAPRMLAISGRQLLSDGSVSAINSPLANFFVAGNTADRGGVRVAAKDADGDNLADLAVGSGEGSPASVRVYLGKNFTGTGEPSVFQDLAVFGGGVLADGVFVG